MQCNAMLCYFMLCYVILCIMWCMYVYVHHTYQYHIESSHQPNPTQPNSTQVYRWVRNSACLRGQWPEEQPILPEALRTCCGTGLSGSCERGSGFCENPTDARFKLASQHQLPTAIDRQSMVSQPYASYDIIRLRIRHAGHTVYPYLTYQH